MCILEARNVKKIFGRQNDANATVAVDSISLKIEEGEFIGIMGPSGSGKTTLLNILSGIAGLTFGDVYIDGENIIKLGRDEMALFRRRKLGFVFQEFNLLDSLTLEENVMLPMILDKKGKTHMAAKSSEIMKLFDIDHIAEKYPYNVSGGQQQRAAVSRALVNDPIILFADEPTGNLDSKSSNSVMTYIKKLNELKHSTILMVTHDTFAASFCKKIIFIKDGSINMEIVSNGNRKEFFNKILDCLAITGGERDDI